jgi:hypothetical protein
MIDGGLRPLFRTHLPQVHWQSIETGGTGKGVPDSNGCFEGHEFWVEFKQTSAWAVNLKPEQIGWMARRARAGGRCLIAIRRKVQETKRLAAVDELFLVEGAFAAELRVQGLRGFPHTLASWTGGPSGWDWEAVLRLLEGSVDTVKK